jgi:hypothetical protein
MAEVEQDKDIQNNERPWYDGGPGTPALPGEPCRTPPHPDWTENEKWAWERICQGEGADFNRQYGQTLDPKKEEDWNEDEKQRRGLSPRFLRTMLTRRPWKDSITERGARIRGAYFAAVVDLDQAGPICELWLDDSRLEGGLTGYDLRVAGVLSLEGSWLGGELSLHRARVDSSLFLRNATFRESVNLRRTMVGDQLSLKGASLAGKLDMDSLEVGDALYMNAGAVFKAEVDLQSAKVGSQLSMSGSTFAGELDLERVGIGSELIMRETVFHKPVKLAFAKISGQLLLEGAKFEAFDLRGSQVAGYLDIRATQVEGILCSKENWAQVLKIDRLSYGHLGGLGQGPDDDRMTSRPASWFIAWLGRQKEYSPQPYEQCAKVLRQAGQPGKANEVLFAGKERERDLAWKQGKIRWFWLSLLRWTMGYGLGWRYLHCLIWVALLTGLGAWVASATPLAGGHTWGWLLGYSFSKLIPLVNLGKNFEALVHGPAQGYFIAHQMAGWALASFVVAGLAGLTK